MLSGARAARFTDNMWIKRILERRSTTDKCVRVRPPTISRQSIQGGLQLFKTEENGSIFRRATFNNGREMMIDADDKHHYIIYVRKSELKRLLISSNSLIFISNIFLNTCN